MKRLLLASAALGLVAAGGTAEARDQIRIVGSSTVFPFTTAVAEQFSRKTQFPAPIVESTGTGGGMQIFCQGVGEGNPDFTNASRRMKTSELELCETNGVEEVVEMKVGFDGIALAHSKSGKEVDLTLGQVYQALAKEVAVDGELVANPNQNWSDIDPSLPNEKIEVLGPPPTSGTRDAFVELAMEVGCEEAGVAEVAGDSADEVCATMREDGAFIEAGENDNLIVQKLVANPAAFGIFGFSYLDQNTDQLTGVAIDGVPVEFDTIADGSYPLSRALFVYAKKAHVGVIPGMEEFVAEYTSEEAMGEDGYLADRGLVPLPEDEAATTIENIKALQPVTAEQLGS